MENKDTGTIRQLMLRLLPTQIIIAFVNSLNTAITLSFSTAFLDAYSMYAVGRFSPIRTVINALGAILSSGTVLLCGEYLGKSDKKKLQNAFSLNLLVSFLLSLIISALLLMMVMFDLTPLFVSSTTARKFFSLYVFGSILGVFPKIMSAQLSVFLSLENQNRRSNLWNILYILTNLFFDALFVIVMKRGVLGLAIASSVSSWIFLLCEASYFLRKDSALKLSLKDIDPSDLFKIIRTGASLNAGYIYQALQSIVVNRLLENTMAFSGVIMYASVNSVLGLVWALPNGMIAVSRMLIGMSTGEEDRAALTAVFRNVLKNYLPLMAIVYAILFVTAGPLTYLNVIDPEPIEIMLFQHGLRIMPLYMFFSIVISHFTCYAQAMGRHWFVQIVSVLDGLLNITIFASILMKLFGIDGLYWAHVLNGVVVILFMLIYAWFKRGRFPNTIEKMLAFDDEFGVEENDRIDISVSSVNEVVSLSRQIQSFCLAKGIDEKRAYLAALATEEMAGNIIEHGFTKDEKKHTIDIRVVYKNDKILLRLKDDCVAFDPEKRYLLSQDDVTRNIGIRMIYKIMDDIRYQNILGMNVMTIRI
ncbi:MAG: ATP-binding protein [Erysipelotrichaceae bacterium]|nr:ATP-binding protein [Erysipelotrichaceae bacterium]